MEADGQLIAIVGCFLLAGVALSLLASRLQLPVLLLFIGLGMAVGSDGLGWIEFGRSRADYDLTLLIGSAALAVILFEAGHSAGFGPLRPVLRPAISLAVVGTAGTAAITGLAAGLIFGLPALESLLLGSILAASDGAAVFALLRGSGLRQRVARTLEGEAGFNDPVAVLLVLGLVEVIMKPGYGVLDLGWLFVKELAIGTAVGLLLPRLMIPLVRRVPAARGVHILNSVAALALAYGGAAAAGGSGFLAAFLAGLVLGGEDLPAREAVDTFHEGLAQLAEVGLFLTLGLLVFPAQLGDVLAGGLALAFVLAFVARPLAAALATAFDPFDARERLIIGWAGLRGAVPVVLATLPVVAGVPGSLEFFDIAFFAVIVSTLVQGVTLEPLARRLGVAGETT